jgi:DNA-binding CsgD family transcriptional regulator
MAVGTPVPGPAIANAPRGALPSVVVDDLQNADAASVALLDQLVGQGAVRLIGAIAEGGPEPAWVTDLWRDRPDSRMRIVPFGGVEVEALLSRVLDGLVDPATALSLSRSAAGNLRYLRELVCASRGSGRLAARHGYWMLTGPATISENLRALVRQDLRAAPVGPLRSLVAEDGRPDPGPVRHRRSRLPSRPVDHGHRHRGLTMRCAETLHRLGDWAAAEARYRGATPIGDGRDVLLLRLANLAVEPDPAARQLARALTGGDPSSTDPLVVAARSLLEDDASGPSDLVDGRNRWSGGPAATHLAAWLVGGLTRLGRPATALRLARAVAADQCAPGDTHAQDVFRAARCAALLLDGQLATVVELAEEQRVRWRAVSTERVTWTWLSGRAQLMRGDLEHAFRLLTEAAGVRASVSAPGCVVTLSRCLADLAIVAAQVGELGRARASLAALLDSPGPPPDLGLVRAWLAAKAGDLAGAAKHAVSAAAECHEKGRIGLMVRCLLDAARLDIEGFQTEPPLVQVDGRLFPAAVAFVQAAADRCPTALSAASIRLLDVQHIPAAVAGLEWSAAWYLRRGERSAAAAARRRARAVTGSRTLRLAPAALPESSSPLTVRERTVALQAAEGRSNREIAAQLDISVRTVENHLQNVYSKLYIRGRDELRPMLAPGSLANDRPR